HLRAVRRDDRRRLLARQRLAPLPGLAFAEEGVGVGGALAEAVPPLLLLEDAERAELYRLLDARARRLDPEELDEGAEGAERLLQHVLVAHDVEPRMRA